MPFVNSTFIIGLKDGAYEKTRTECCCAFLADKLKPTRNVVELPKNSLSIKEVRWWLRFLKSIGLKAKCSAVTKRTVRRRRLDNPEWDNITQVYLRRGWHTIRSPYVAKGTLLTVVDKTNSTTLICSLNINGSGSRLLVPRGNLSLSPDRHVPLPSRYIYEITETSEQKHYCIEYTGNGGGSTLLLHTAIRYLWHREGQLVIKECLRLSVNTHLTPYEILIIAHHNKPMTDYDVLMSYPAWPYTATHEEFLKRYNSNVHGVQYSFINPSRFLPGKDVTLAQRLLREKKYKQYFKLLWK